MTDYEAHYPDYDGTTTSEWDAPQETDFDTGDLGEIADHFVLSADGFPPENFTDLQLPVVEPGGDLNLNALRTAYSGGHGVDSVDGLSDDEEQRARGILQELADEFDEDLD